MGYRLSKIYTRTGDNGSTGLGDGSRVEKGHPRVEAYGTVDELNAVLGMLLTQELPEPIRQLLTNVQHDLFDIGGELSIPGHTLVTDDATGWLERNLDHYNAPLAPLEDFILPGGTAAAAACHLARTVCRRAERHVVSLAARESVNPAVIAYLNRLSDLLFVLARALNRGAGAPDVLWRRDRQRNTPGG